MKKGNHSIRLGVGMGTASANVPGPYVRVSKSSRSRRAAHVCRGGGPECRTLACALHHAIRQNTGSFLSCFARQRARSGDLRGRLQWNFSNRGDRGSKERLFSRTTPGTSRWNESLARSLLNCRRAYRSYVGLDSTGTRSGDQ